MKKSKKIYLQFLYLVLILCLILSINLKTNAWINTKAFVIPDIRNFTFTSESSKIIKGLSSEKAKGWNCSHIKIDDSIGNLTLGALFYQNGCYTNGKYSHKNFKVEKGIVKDNNGEYRFTAYRIYEPTHKAKKFLASKHAIFYKFETKDSYTLYSLEDKRIEKVAEIPASHIKTNTFIKIKNTEVSSIVGFRTYFMVPTKLKLSAYTQFSESVEGANVFKTKLGDVLKYRYLVKKTAFDNKLDYSNTRQFFLFKTKKQISVIWQNKQSKSILLTKFSEDLRSQKTISLKNSSKAQLIAAAFNNKNHFFYATIQDRKHSKSILTLYKIDEKGELIKKSKPNTSKSKLNIFRFGNYMAHLKYLNNQLGLFIARTMHKSNDGLNHQGGIAVLFNANDLSVIRNFGQTSGHSFDNYLTSNSAGEFLGIDLGDNYPRGINLHKFDKNKRRSKVIYTFKTEHGSRTKSPSGKRYPFYAEISKGKKKYYKWSNDNGTYSAIGAVIETSEAYIVLFTGEPDPNGKSINNARAGYGSPDPRNIGFIKIVKNFEIASGKGNVVSNDIILSKGITETGGFYTFGGHWAKQRNTGVIWLTNYKNKKVESAYHLKAVKLKNDSILLVWQTQAKEKYKGRYKSTYALKIDANGKKLSPIIKLGSHLRLNRRDEMLVIGNKVFIISGIKAEKKLELTIIDLD